MLETGNNLEGFTQIKHYERGGGIWVPSGKVGKYTEYVDPLPAAEVVVDFKGVSTDFKHQILPADLAMLTDQIPPNA